MRLNNCVASINLLNYQFQITGLVRSILCTTTLETPVKMKLLLFCLFASISLSLANGECHVSVWLLVLRYYFFGHVTSFAMLLNDLALVGIDQRLQSSFKEVKGANFLRSRIRCRELEHLSTNLLVLLAISLHI